MSTIFLPSKAEILLPSNQRPNQSPTASQGPVGDLALADAQVLLIFPFDENKSDRIREIRRCLIDHLERELSGSNREELIRTTFSADAVRVSIWGNETASALARHLIEVNHRWRWL